MKKKSDWRTRFIRLCAVVLPLIVLCFTACKDEDKEENLPFDPTKPVVITDFSPKSGGVGNNIILYGENFGNDPKKLKVIVGGKEANIISVKNNILYCVVPRMATEGDVEISVYDDNGEEVAFAEAEEKFTYVKQWLVSTLAGQRFENEKDAVQGEGAFDACGCIKGATWFSFDPRSNFDHLYLTCYKAGAIRLIDLEEKTVTMLPHLAKTTDRPALINWTTDENQDMIVSCDLEKEGNIHVLKTRVSEFKSEVKLGQKHKGVTGAFVHPNTGKLYYTIYPDQEIYEYNLEDKTTTKIAKHPRVKETLRMVVHPTGKYAYLLRQYNERGNGYISRMDYNSAGQFTTPYIVAGSASGSGYRDGVGSKVQMNGPTQGVFVKNPEYLGEEDEYDFYFCDERNHCIRILTPTGRVVTFAGRGNDSSDPGFANGALRSEARFAYPWAIAYDEKRKCFYVGERGMDRDGKEQAVIRKIAMEE